MGFENRGFRESGRTFESRLFGPPRMKGAFLKDLDKIRKNPRGRFDDGDPEIERQVFEAFKRNYEGTDSARGETSQSTDLRTAVEEALGMEDQDPERLRLYTTAGTPIDFDFGTDAFFEMRDPETGAIAIVKLDATLNMGKTRHKADIFIRELPDAADEETADDYLEKIEKYGKDIARKLRGRLAEAKQRLQRRAA